MWTSDLHEALPKRQFDTLMVFSTVAHTRPYFTPFSRTGLFLEHFSPAKIEAFPVDVRIVPQGAFLGAVRFLLFVNDMLLHFHK